MDWPPYPPSLPHCHCRSFTQLKVSVKDFTPQLLINNSSEFRWVGIVIGKWFLATGFSSIMKQKLALLTELGVSVFKLMDSAENKRKKFIEMNEALKKQAEAK